MSSRVLAPNLPSYSTLSHHNPRFSACDCQALFCHTTVFKLCYEGSFRALYIGPCHETPPISADPVCPVLDCLFHASAYFRGHQPAFPASCLMRLLMATWRSFPPSCPCLRAHRSLPLSICSSWVSPFVLTFPRRGPLIALHHT